MTLFRRWRRIQPVATRPVAFDESPDFHGDLFPDAGETFPSLAPRAAPRPFSSIGSLLLDHQIEQLVFPARSRVRSFPRPSRRPGRHDALSRAVIKASFREFNRLQANPRARLCVSRRQRREVLFAQRVAGRRGSAPGRGRRYVRNLNSSWSC